MSAVGPLLSEYRKMNRLSQLDLSLMADVSARHISFIETDRSSPSRSMLLRLADVLHLPHKDSNLLLHSGGYTAVNSELDLEAVDMAPVKDALQLILDNHNPYPALVMDGSWNVLMANTAQQVMTAQIMDGRGPPPTMNLLEAVFCQDCYRPLIENWDELASHTLRRLRKQVLAFGKASDEALYKRLLELSPPDNWQQQRFAGGRAHAYGRFYAQGALFEDVLFAEPVRHGAGCRQGRAAHRELFPCRLAVQSVFPAVYKLVCRATVRRLPSLLLAWLLP